MGIFNFGKKPAAQPIASAAWSTTTTPPPTSVDAGRLAELALKTIQDGILIVNKDKVIKFINPAAVDMTGCGKAENAINLDFSLIMKLERTDGEKVDENNNELTVAVKTNQEFESREYVLVSKEGDKKTPIALCITPSGDGRSDRIITFRNIAKELEEEGAQTEFISTASHEMRTPVASIEGYLGLALNPQTATIDARARQYLESAHNASQHLGNLFRDLLDVTRLDDKRIRPHLVPVELTGFVKKFSDEYIPKFKEKNISYSFGADLKNSKKFASGGKSVEQVVYTFADVDFLGEIMANLIENAIKYTPEGGAVWVNVQGDGDKALINVTDTGIGIAAEDLQHIFQKFYRADNSQTRTVGGTGLGLYLVKSRVEAMTGRVWAESAFGEGSTFYVSLPRLTAEEFEKRQIAEQNKRTVQAFADKDVADNIAQNAARMAANQGQASGPNFSPMILTNAQQAASAPMAATPVMTPNPSQQIPPAPVAQPTPSQPNVAMTPQMPTQPMPQASVQQPAQVPQPQQVVPPVQPAMQPAVQAQPQAPTSPAIQSMQSPIYQKPAMQVARTAPTLTPNPTMSQPPIPQSPLPPTQPAMPPIQNQQNIIQ